MAAGERSVPRTGLIVREEQAFVASALSAAASSSSKSPSSGLAEAFAASWSRFRKDIQHRSCGPALVAAGVPRCVAAMLAGGVTPGPVTAEWLAGVSCRNLGCGSGCGGVSHLDGRECRRGRQHG